MKNIVVKVIARISCLIELFYLTFIKVYENRIDDLIINI
jgi:hypothetical protein